MKWNEVTWYSKLGAIVLFIGIVPAGSFFVGMQFQQFISSTNEYVVSPEIGYEPVELKEEAKKTFKHAFTSPDGQYIAKEYSTEEISDTYIEDREGKEIVGRHAGSFKSWFPDSEKLLLFVSDVHSSDGRRHMYILTVGGEYFDTGLPAGTYDAAYRHSDAAVAYTLERQRGSDAADIYIRDTNGNDRLLVKGDSNIFVSLTWSEDGKKISFKKDTLAGNNEGMWEINEDGTGLTRLDDN